MWRYRLSTEVQEDGIGMMCATVNRLKYTRNQAVFKIYNVDYSRHTSIFILCSDTRPSYRQKFLENFLSFLEEVYSQTFEPTHFS